MVGYLIIIVHSISRIFTTVSLHYTFYVFSVLSCFKELLLHYFHYEWIRTYQEEPHLVMYGKVPKKKKFTASYFWSSFIHHDIHSPNTKTLRNLLLSMEYGSSMYAQSAESLTIWYSSTSTLPTEKSLYLNDFRHMSKL